MRDATTPSTPAFRPRHWAATYVGAPWKAGASGPHEYDCWGLASVVQRDHYKRELPDLTPAGLRGALRRLRWQAAPAHGLDLAALADGDMLSMRGTSGPHVAVVIDAGGGALRVLHAVGSAERPGSVVVNEIHELAELQFTRVRVWKYIA